VFTVLPAASLKTTRRASRPLNAKTCADGVATQIKPKLLL
jgi:hypothetical protein